MKQKVKVFIGRMQPFHNAHKKIIDDALNTSDKVILLVGSYREPLSARNPWNAHERAEMIQECYKDNDRLILLPMRDYKYNDNHWITSVQNIVSNNSSYNDNDIYLVGHFKDDSSYYLNFFGGWHLETVPNYWGLNSTDIRYDFFLNNKLDKNKIPKEVYDYLISWKEQNEERFNNVKEELQYIINYKKQWESCPYPPVFNTTDAVVVKSGHILLIKRGINPGKGKFALPGGFLGINDTHFKSCLRELKEETKIDVPHGVLYHSCDDKEGKKFDHPRRDPRGRVVTTAYFFDLTEKKSSLRPLPKVKGSDDAAEAIWMPFNDVFHNEENFFSDHIHIIQHYISIGR
jgi:bifunctional NMN adenylyltransferase/nudix hydrolase